MSKYTSAIRVATTACKHWQYIEKELYKIVLNNGESIEINLNILSKEALDVVEIRFYNICNSGGYGTSVAKMYARVDGKPALPTIGVTPTLVPMYVALPKCPSYGTTKVDVWDTSDTRKVGRTKYVYTYSGSSPLKVKTLELYIVKNK